MTARPGYLRAVLLAISWQTCLTAVGLGTAVILLRWLQNAGQAPPNFIYSSLVITGMGAVLVMLGTLAADEAVRRGARFGVANCTALVAAGVLTAVGQYVVRSLLHLYTAVSQPGVPNAVQRTQMIFVFFDVAIFGGLAMFIYVNRNLARRTLEDVRCAELKRVEAERVLTEASLAAARARVDPDALFADLDRIRRLYLTPDVAAEPELDALIARLSEAVRPVPAVAAEA